jgi:hypothetical protein
MIKTKEATLATLSVEVKALRVSDKQMTLAVFRQLPEGSISHSKDGILWGIVRYKIEDEVNWIVYSLDGKLYRRAIDLSPTYRNRRSVEEWEGCIRSCRSQKGAGSRYYDGYDEWPDFLQNNIPFSEDKSARERAELKLKEERIEWLEEWLMKARNHLRREEARLEEEKKFTRELPQLFISV